MCRQNWPGARTVWVLSLPCLLFSQSHFSMTTRSEAGFEDWVLGPSQSSSASVFRRDHWRSSPGPCCCWWLGLPRALVKVYGWALT